MRTGQWPKTRWNSQLRREPTEHASATKGNGKLRARSSEHVRPGPRRARRRVGVGGVGWGVGGAALDANANDAAAGRGLPCVLALAPGADRVQGPLADRLFPLTVGGTSRFLRSGVKRGWG